jgi:hypothetical protein
MCAVDDLLDERVALRVRDEADRYLVLRLSGGGHDAKAQQTPKPNTRVAHAKNLPMNMNVSSASFAFLS